MVLLHRKALHDRLPLPSQLYAATCAGEGCSTDLVDAVNHAVGFHAAQNEITKKCAPPCATTDAIFYAGTGMLLCRSEDKVTLFDVQQRSTLAELSTPYVK